MDFTSWDDQPTPSNDRKAVLGLASIVVLLVAATIFVFNSASGPTDRTQARPSASPSSTPTPSKQVTPPPLPRIAVQIRTWRPTRTSHPKRTYRQRTYQVSPERTTAPKPKSTTSRPTPTKNRTVPTTKPATRPPSSKPEPTQKPEPTEEPEPTQDPEPTQEPETPSPEQSGGQE